jgi:ABC-type Mn2+/Zn2+ transport system ATPase subunit
MISINCDNISFSYGIQESIIFDSISFTFKGPGFHALFGESGVGKSTMAKIISGMMIPHQGKVNYRKISRILYTTNQEKLPGWQSIASHYDSVLCKEKQSLWRNMMSEFGIEHCQHARFAQLSLGQQNRVNLIRYLLQDTPVIIMDESLANVDEHTRENIIVLIKKQFPEKCFIYISHHVREVCKFCDQIVVLRHLPKKPQVMSIKGQNLYEVPLMDHLNLEQNMLELVHVS